MGWKSSTDNLSTTVQTRYSLVIVLKHLKQWMHMGCTWCTEIREERSVHGAHLEKMALHEIHKPCKKNLSPSARIHPRKDEWTTEPVRR